MIAGLFNPAGTYIGEHGSPTSQQLDKQLAQTVQHIFFCSQDIGFAGAVVVEGGG